MYTTLKVHPCGPFTKLSKFFHHFFDVDCEEASLELQIELIDLRRLENFEF